jgi:hypothetical protein
MGMPVNWKKFWLGFTRVLKERSSQPHQQIHQAQLLLASSKTLE